MARLIECHTHRDPRGVLTVAERELPFPAVRLFWITEADGHTRGGHRHRHAQLVLFAVTGKVIVDVQSPDGAHRYELDRPNLGLQLDPEDWHTMQFFERAVLLAVASTPFDPRDYIVEPHRPVS